MKQPQGQKRRYFRFDNCIDQGYGVRGTGYGTVFMLNEQRLIKQ